MTAEPARRLKVAIVCPTIGQTRRGYERYLTELMRTVEADVDVTLFKGAGENTARERVVPHLRRTGPLRLLPERLAYARYRLEFATFAARLIPQLTREDFDLVHFIDPPLARPLDAARKRAARPFRLLFSDAGPRRYNCYNQVDHVHCLTPAARGETLAEGVAPERISTIPIGVDVDRVRKPAARDEVRRRLGVPEGTFVILCVASVNRAHKRVDYLIREAAGLRGEFLLWLDGSLHPDGERDLIAMGEAALGKRFRYTHVDSERVGELFAAADVLVSAATRESFGMAIVEAMTAGLPVIAHDSEHFRWLTGGNAILVDMAVSGALAEVLALYGDDPSRLRACAVPDGTPARFGWENLRADYLRMYETATAGAGVSRQP